MENKNNKHFGLKTLGSIGLTGAGIIASAVSPVGIPVLLYGAIKTAKNLKKDYINMIIVLCTKQ